MTPAALSCLTQGKASSVQSQGCLLWDPGTILNPPNGCLQHPPSPAHLTTLHGEGCEQKGLNPLLDAQSPFPRMFRDDFVQ